MLYEYTCKHVSVLVETHEHTRTPARTRARSYSVRADKHLLVGNVVEDIKEVPEAEVETCLDAPC